MSEVNLKVNSSAQRKSKRNIAAAFAAPASIDPKSAMIDEAVPK